MSKEGPIFSALAPTHEEKKKALDFHRKLESEIPALEKEFEKAKKKTKKGFSMDDKTPRKIGRKLRHLICDEYSFPEEEIDWIFKAIQEIYSTPGVINVGKRRDNFRYMFEVANIPINFYNAIGWDGWRRLMDSPTIRSEKRFTQWLRNKYNDIKDIKKGFIREFAKQVNALLKNKDATIYDRKELFAIYEKAWKQAAQAS